MLTAKTISASGLPLPIWSKKVKENLTVNYPLAAQVASPLLSLFQSLQIPSNYFRQIEPLHWSGTGANSTKKYVLDKADIKVFNVEGFKKALATVQKGQTIVLLPGVYTFEQNRIDLTAKGSISQPITVLAEKLGTVTLNVKGEGFLVNKPYWQFKNLYLKGGCSTNHSKCDHAFHVVGRGQGFKLENNIVEGFNAAIKVNGLNGNYPDSGKILRNTIYNRTARKTRKPVTPIDLMHADNWIVQENFIFDILKSAGDKISYAAFFKGGSSHGVFERNLIMCNANLKGSYTSVGLSLGGGGSRQNDRRNSALFEHNQGVVRNNIIMHCANDVGLYLNRAQQSKIENNLLYNTQGIDIRYVESSAIVKHNVLSGKIRTRNDASVKKLANLERKNSFFYGEDGLNDFFVAPSIGNFNWKKEPPLIPNQEVHELSFDWCGIETTKSYLGAFQNSKFCLDSMNF